MLILSFFSFFLTSKGHSTTQAWGGLDNQTGIKQPIKYNSLWKNIAVLDKKSEIWFHVRRTWMMLKSGKHICSVSILSNSIVKFGQAWGSFIITINSLQSVSKVWHVEYWSIFSIAHHNASTSECKADSQCCYLKPLFVPLRSHQTIFGIHFLHVELASKNLCLSPEKFVIPSIPNIPDYPGVKI